MRRNHSAAGQATRLIWYVATIAVAAACTAPPRTDLHTGHRPISTMRYSFAFRRRRAVHAWANLWVGRLRRSAAGGVVLDGSGRRAGAERCRVRAQARVTQGPANAEIEGVRFDSNIDAAATLSGSTADDNVTEGRLNVSGLVPARTSRGARSGSRSRADRGGRCAGGARPSWCKQLSGDIALRFVRYSTNDERLRKRARIFERRQTLAGARVDSQVEAGGTRPQLDLFRGPRLSPRCARRAACTGRRTGGGRSGELTAATGRAPRQVSGAKLAPGPRSAVAQGRIVSLGCSADSRARSAPHPPDRAGATRAAARGGYR